MEVQAWTIVKKYGEIIDECAVVACVAEEINY